MLMLPPSEAPKMAARSEPTASITARTSSIRCSSVGSWSAGTGSDIPVPRLSNRITREDGTLINEHDEDGGQEEVYVVLDGTATFEIDGETLEAPAGTFVSVEPEARRKATGDATVLALGGTVGEAYQAMDWGEAWPIQN